MVKILAVCDAPWVENQIRAALEGTAEIVQVSESYQADRVAATEGPDLAIVDLQISSMGGMAVTRALKGGSLGESPIIMLLDRRADAFIARRAGADAWVTKPFTAQELRSALSDLQPAGVDR